MDSANDSRIDAGDSYLKEYMGKPFIDIHCHCLPGIDDGPATMAESLALCRKLVQEGIDTVVATPHQLGRFEGCNDAVKVREAVHKLNESLRENDIALKVVPGGEIRLDERICQLLRSDKILTLADGAKYILIELPSQVFINIEPLIKELSSMGIQPVISHIEKNTTLAGLPEVLNKWLANNTLLQITSSSLLGDFGSEAQKNAWYFLSSGKARLIATDSHGSNGRRPRMKAAFERICDRLGEGLANEVCIGNPSKIINGQKIGPASLHSKKEVDS